MTWDKNITEIELGKYRTINGNADELIGIGRCIKAGFACSKVETTNGRYDAVIDPGGDNPKLLRVQIKGTDNGNIKYTAKAKDCDIILAVDSNNGDCYIIPIGDIQNWSNSKKISKLQEYKENWELLRRIISG